MEEEDGVLEIDPARVAPGLSDRAVVDRELREPFSARKPEVSNHEVAGDGLGKRRRREGERAKRSRQEKRHLHPTDSHVASQRVATRRAIAKRTTDAPRSTPTCGQRFVSGSSRQKTFLKPSMAQAFSVMSPSFWIFSERR